MLKRLLPQWAAELLQLVRDDPQRFHELVVNSHDGDRPYSTIPVLSKIPPQDFMDAWLSGPKERQRWVSWALARRYEWGFRPEWLNAERSWALSVCRLLDGKASNVGGYKGMRIFRLIPNVLRELSQSEKDGTGIPLNYAPQAISELRALINACPHLQTCCPGTAPAHGPGNDDMKQGDRTPADWQSAR